MNRSGWTTLAILFALLLAGWLARGWLWHKLLEMHGRHG